MKHRPILLILIASLLVFAGLGALPPAAAAPQRDSTAAFVPGEVVVVTKPGYTAKTLGIPAGVSVLHTSPQLDRLHAVVLHVPAGQERDYARQLQGSQGVQSAEPD